MAPKTAHILHTSHQCLRDRIHLGGWTGVPFHRPSYHINRDFPETNFRRNDSSIAASLEFHRVAHSLFLQITTNDRSSSAPDIYWSKTCTPPPLAPMTGSNVSESPAYECNDAIAIMSLCARQHIVFVLSTISRGWTFMIYGGSSRSAFTVTFTGQFNNIQLLVCSSDRRRAQVLVPD